MPVGCSIPNTSPVAGKRAHPPSTGPSRSTRRRRSACSKLRVSTKPTAESPNSWKRVGGRCSKRTQWIVGPRDIPPSLGDGPFDQGLGFLALWDWNDAWHRASTDERAAYDLDCDVAFEYDVELGCDIFGRFDVGATSDWDHAALWEVPDLHTLTKAMHGHEIQDDFMFTTSYHLIGRPIALDRLEAKLS